MMTDFILGATAAIIAYKLYLYPGASPAISIWSTAFVLISLSALLGGIYHGARHIAGERFNRYTWKAVLYALAGASFLFLCAASFTVPVATVKIALIIFAAIKLLISIGAIYSSDRFRMVMYDYLISMVITAVLYSLFMPPHATLWFATGMIMSLIASAIQLRKIAPKRYLDHNDIYHLLQALALIMMYKGIIAAL